LGEGGEKEKRSALSWKQQWRENSRTFMELILKKLVVKLAKELGWQA
jgi:hypothetical protein